jgi:hypothetical protein
MRKIFHLRQLRSFSSKNHGYEGGGRGGKREAKREKLPYQFLWQVCRHDPTIMRPKLFQINRRPISPGPGGEGGEGIRLEGGREGGREGGKEVGLKHCGLNEREKRAIVRVEEWEGGHAGTWKVRETHKKGKGKRERGREAGTPETSIARGSRTLKAKKVWTSFLLRSSSWTMGERRGKRQVEGRSG